ncbi:hypothetical protein Pogu_1567 [Pyrobaculum oguniense TE7]|uniref:Uncharacterized protein n=1 Tax=Pyrobaculum oguniense (strain DSM 13380 / JCM 10595 / TE7) TaxID=698757 RepID=H6Q965_PYROT|nr:hypothetical protein Pogu_1567 [Pyrobaculum oguniense TE7]
MSMVGRRRFLKILGGSALALSAGGLLAYEGLLRGAGGQKAEIPPGGFWFEKLLEEPSNDDVILEFVDEEEEPLDFSAFLIWEPTGEVEEVAVKNGKLKIPKKRLKEQAERWADKLKSEDQPTLTENPLFTLLPISLPGDLAPYVAVPGSPRFANRRYKLHGARHKGKSTAPRFAGCSEGKLLYSSDQDIRELIPAVAFRDSSSRAFGEYIDFSYHVRSSALKITLYGAVATNFGASVRITKEYSWSTGDLSQDGGVSYSLTRDGQNAAALFYSQKWRFVVYELYDPSTCLIMDEVFAIYPTQVAFDANQRIALRVTEQLPPTAFDETQPAETRSYQGIDGRGGYNNMFRYSEILIHEPFIDVDVAIGGLPIGKALRLLGTLFSDKVGHVHAAFNFQIYVGVANYVATVATDADKGAGYRLRLYRARYKHMVGDYEFYPLRISAETAD